MKDCRACKADGYRIDHATRERVECRACVGYGEIEDYEGEHEDARLWEIDRERHADWAFGDDDLGPYDGREKTSKRYY